MLQTVAKLKEQPNFGWYGGDDRDDWIVADIGRNRDSDLIDESNWDEAVKAMEEAGSEDYEILRFNHWACGWVENIIIRPGSKCAAVMDELVARLEDYPVLNEEDFSRREWESYLQAWRDWGRRNFVKELAEMIDDCEDAADFLDSLDDDVLREFYESLRTNGEYYTAEGSGVSIRVKDAADDCDRSDLAAFIADHDGPRVPEFPMPAVEYFPHELCPKCDTPSQPFDGVRDQHDRECPTCGHQWWEFVKVRAVR